MWAYIRPKLLIVRLERKQKIISEAILVFAFFCLEAKAAKNYPFERTKAITRRKRVLHRCLRRHRRRRRRRRRCRRRRRRRRRRRFHLLLMFFGRLKEVMLNLIWLFQWLI